MCADASDAGEALKNESEEQKKDAAVPASPVAAATPVVKSGDGAYGAASSAAVAKHEEEGTPSGRPSPPDRSPLPPSPEGGGSWVAAVAGERTSPRRMSPFTSPRKHAEASSPVALPAAAAATATATVGAAAVSAERGDAVPLANVLSASVSMIPKAGARTSSLLSSSPLTMRASWSAQGPAPDLSRLPRDIVFSIIAFLSDRDLFSLSVVNKRMCMYCLSDFLVFERRFKRQFPFDMGAMWRVMVKRYPMLGVAGGGLSLREKTAVVEKYIRDTIDRNTDKWDVDGFQLFVDNGVCKKDQKAIFCLFNFMRNPALRTGKAKDRFFENAELLKETLDLFDLSNCTLFEALHVVFGHALSLPGEAQKIDRAMSAFGAAFRRSCSESLRESNTEDAFYILAFAMVMLNSDLHNPAVKARMSLQQFRRNLEGAIVLSAEESLECYMQVLRCEMVEGSYFTAKLTKPVWLVRHKGPLGYKRVKRANITLCAGELVVDGTQERFSLRGCLIARNVVAVPLATMRNNSGPSDMPLLHVLRVGGVEDPDTLLAKRLQGDLIMTCDNPEDLKDLQRAMAAHVLPGLQARLNGTMRKLSEKLRAE